MQKTAQIIWFIILLDLLATSTMARSVAVQGAAQKDFLHRLINKRQNCTPGTCPACNDIRRPCGDYCGPCYYYYTSGGGYPCVCTPADSPPGTYGGCACTCDGGRGHSSSYCTPAS